MVATMRKIADGKTKTLYALGEDQVVLVFKDDVTGTDGGVDPGGNRVVGHVEGKGLAALRQSAYFFSLLAAHGVPTHFVSVDLDEGILIARRATWYGLEFVVRFRAFGSFVRRYGRYVQEGADLGALVEITLKDDERGDPLIVDEALDVLGIMPLDKVHEGKALVRKAAILIREDLSTKGLELVDMKFECGMVDERLVIIDDISTDNMRVMREGRMLSPQELLELTVGSPSD
jgi:phosphoribosylaminoimidazole-succinocarboxamide synthase